MDNKIYDLIEKVYVELVSFKKETNERFGSIGQKFDSIDQKFDLIDQRFDSIDQEFGSIDQRFGSIDQKFDKLQNEVEMNGKHIVKLENKLSEKIGALFDHREIVNDKLETIDKKLDQIDEKIDKAQFDINNLTMKVAQSDNKIIELKQNLKTVK
ncbi:MAG: hypothetical protein JM58_17030 [Peptococcaceae bacterium BICA1-8]|nr:MAG: hypothetical protein JM58_17030 [Peptococcaceae bacterium BICA1-8]